VKLHRDEPPFLCIPRAHGAGNRPST
jgi:hypothetical protein